MNKKILISYLKRQRYLFILFLLIAGLFTIVFSLYNMPLEPILYAFMIGLYAVLLFLFIDYIRFYKYHNYLVKMQKSITSNLEQLPLSHDLIEQDYSALIQILYQDKMQIISQTDHARTDMIDYFTLWAHQIKTPIAAMNLLLQKEENKHNRELAVQLFSIEQYVETVLQYLRLGTIHSDFLLKTYSLDSLVKQAIRKYAKLFIQKKIRLHLNELNSHVLTDEKWLVFVIEQIISNAIKYTKEGSISIYMHPDMDKTLVIEDTGIGIAAEDLPRVFEKGYTGYNGRADKKATGIGLYLCHQIIAKLSHHLSIESEVGKGTKVLIDLAREEFRIE